MKLLIHTCCAPCATYTAKEFSKDHEVTLFWFNPNIHPFKEYKKRFKTLQEFEEKTDHDVIYRDEYRLENFLEGALRADTRCEFCYRWRLSETAKEAKKRDFDAYTTTLSISPYQDHDLIKQMGGEEGEKNDVKFVYKDLTDGFYESHDMADEMNLYKQGYCGCIFSERDRYEKNLMDLDEK